MTTDIDQDFTPTLAQVIKDAVEQRLTEVHVCLPAQVVSYDSSKQMATVQPSFLRKYQTGEVVQMPVINNVPVAFPRAGKAYLSLPMNAGDHVLLVFSERSLDVWLSAGGIVDPNDSRKHHISDAIAIPGCYPFNNPISGASSSDVVLGNDQSKIVLQPSGKFKIQKTGGDELFDLIDQLFQLFAATTTMTLMGPQPFVNSAQYLLLQAKFAAMKGA